MNINTLHRHVYELFYLNEWVTDKRVSSKTPMCKITSCKAWG